MAKNTVKLKKYLDVVNEYVAAAAITPGQLIELDTNGEVQRHSSAGQNAAAIFALEDELQGNGIDDNYAADDQVQCWFAVPGEEVYAVLEDGETVVIGDFLESAGNGNLQKHTADVIEAHSSGEALGDTTIYTQQIVAQALEALDLSGSSGVESSGIMGDQRLKVRVV